LKRLTEEIQNHQKIEKELTIELENAKNCEKLAILANNIGMVQKRQQKAIENLDQYANIVAILTLGADFESEIAKLQADFERLGLAVKHSIYFLDNPNEKVIEELNQKFAKAENDAKKLEKELFEKLSEDSSGGAKESISRAFLEFFTDRFHQISIINEKSSNIIAGDINNYLFLNET
jgi:valyl-tRNA synthetase